MKNIVKIQSMLLLAFFITLPFFLFTQEEEAVEKKVRIKTVKEVDGKKIVTDTTFTVKEDDDVKKIVKKYTVTADGDSSTNVMIDVIVESDGDIEFHEGHKKVIIMKSGDGEEYEFDYDYDIDMENLNEEMAKLNAEMREMQIEIIDEHGKVHSELIELQHIKELEHLEELEELKNMEFIVVPPAPHAPHHYNDFTWKHKGDMEVSDEELRDAGIKNKPDRLELDEIDIEKEEGVIDLSFSLKEEGSPKVEVYNIYGDKVFSGKPELMNSKYQIKMDLSKKQYGTYYMQIILGSSSKTLRLTL